MQFLAAIIWWALGLYGALLIWRSEMKFCARLYRREPVFCPTPRAILFSMVTAILGPALFLAGFITALLDLLEGRPKTKTWWTRPICRSKHPQQQS